jgi:hypothetical protein
MKRSRTLLQQVPDPENPDWVLDIAVVPSFWVVVYAGAPVAIRRVHQARDLVRYQNRVYTELGRAQTQARELNESFGTDLFTVAEISAK